MDTGNRVGSHTNRSLLLVLVTMLALAACGDGTTSETSEDVDPEIPPTGTAPATGLRARST